MDCAICHYPNDDGARFCARCAAPVGIPVASLPTEPVPMDLVSEQALAAAAELGSPRRVGDPLGDALIEALAATQAPAAEAGGGSAARDRRAAAAEPLLGGRYRLLRCLGSGGFGAVYEAEEVAVGLRVAIKLLNRAALADARMRERFLQEARMIAGLRSPHVVTLHDYAVTPPPSRMPYLVMELLSGKPLSHDMMRGVLAPRRALHIMAQVCAALGEAHAAGIVHRDIKPDNILLVRRGDETSAGYDPDFVKVVDFGVARLCGPETRASDVLGTPAYISPETLASEPVDGRCDLYAVGMLLWQTIVGELPFPGRNQAEMMKSHLEAERRWPRLVNPRVRLPEALEELMTRLIARHPAERPASAYAVRAQLLAILDGTADKGQSGDGEATRPGAATPLADYPLRGMPLPNFGPCWDAPASNPKAGAAQTAPAPAQGQVSSLSQTAKWPNP
jgi:serine/threonine-protein kinase